MKHTNMSIFAISLIKEGQLNEYDKNCHLRGATSIQSWRMVNRSLVPFCIHGGLGLPALVIAHIVIYLISIK